MKSKLFVEVKKEGGSENRKPSEEELQIHKRLLNKIELRRDKIRKLKEELDALEKTCKHIISVDIAGWPYDSRFCATCGMSQGLV